MNLVFTELAARYPDLGSTLPALEQAAGALTVTFRAGGKLLICGNGGSASDSDHIVGELMKSFERPRPIADDLRQRLLGINPERGAYLVGKLQRGLPAISLASHAALSTAIGNDIAGDMSFAQQVMGYGKPGDSLIAISTSGNSVNVLNALQVARALNMTTIGLTGQSGGQLKPLCDVLVTVPFTRTLEVQERHLAVYHALCLTLEQEFFG
jgi:D-sedoheptulose 7-phosphate isomerase